MKIEETTVELANINSKLVLQKNEHSERTEDIKILSDKIKLGFRFMILTFLM